MFKDYLYQTCDIIKKAADFTWGLAWDWETIISTEKCRLTSPNERDFKLIQDKEIWREIWKIYLNKWSLIDGECIIKVWDKEYKPVYIYRVHWPKKEHHVKVLATYVE